MNEYDKAWEQWQPTENIEIQKVVEFYRERMEFYVSLRQPWNDEYILRDLKLSQNTDSFVLIADIYIAKGEEPKILVCGNQSSAFELLFDIRTDDLFDSKNPLIVEVENPANGTVVESRIDWTGNVRPPKPSQLIISKGLAKKLGGNPKQIRIMGLYQNIDNLDLDEI